MPVAFDFNGDGKKEIVVGCTGSSSYPAGIYIFKEDGTNYNASNPVYTPATGNRTDCTPVIADIDNDGTYEILFVSAQSYTANIYAMKPDGTLLSGWNTANHSIALSNDAKDATDTDYGLSIPDISVGDLDKDGRLKVICGDNGHLYVWNYLGALVTDIVIPGYIINAFRAPIIADVDNDTSNLEIVVSGAATLPSLGSSIYAYKVNFSTHIASMTIGYPISIPESISNSLCVSDLDNNGFNELMN